MPQNIYDDAMFFQRYLELREKEWSANNIEERPSFQRMLPDVSGKRILDLGCGAGIGCMDYIRAGAESVTGLDVSQRMIALAQAENSHERIRYVLGDMERLETLQGEYDLITSCLAMHYIENFPAFAGQAFRLLCPGGFLVFSQEHPIFTAPAKGPSWVTDMNGQIQGMQLDRYSVSGQRSVSWLVDGVIKYHRTFSDILNPLISAGFVLEELSEPQIHEDYFQYDAQYTRTNHVPDYLILRARKP